MSARLKPLNNPSPRPEHNRCNVYFCQANDLRPRDSNIEAEMHDVRFTHHVILALQSQSTGFAGAGFAAILNVIIEGDHLGADEAALEIRVDDPGRLRRSAALAHRPGADLLGAGGEICNEAEQLVGAANHAIETGLVQTEIGQEG